MVLTGEQVKLIRNTKPNLNVCQANVFGNELWVSGLTRFKVKALLTKAQLIEIVNTMTRFNAKLVVKNVLSSGQALIKATVVVCKPEKRRALSKKLAAHSELTSATPKAWNAICARQPAQIVCFAKHCFSLRCAAGEHA
ncbi:SsrA-binding protein [Candidatus Hodgkinia cicadicola]|nr:SsrA-binding protein [Candidatus Hodgkinia cicadicola]